MCILQDVYDKLDYLSSLGKTQTAAVRRDADIGVAEAERDAGIRVRVPCCVRPSFIHSSTILLIKHTLFILCFSWKIGMHRYHFFTNRYDTDTIPILLFVYLPIPSTNTDTRDGPIRFFGTDTDHDHLKPHRSDYRSEPVDYVGRY